MILALEEMHAHNIVYRDLKPENVVIGSDGYLLLTDFGLSKLGVEDAIRGAQSFCGSVAYLAPEMLNKKGNFIFFFNLNCWTGEIDNAWNIDWLIDWYGLT